MNNENTATVNEVIVGSTKFRIEDIVEGETKSGKLIKGPIATIHPSVFGDHSAQVYQGKDDQGRTICELIDLSRARKV